MKRYATTAAALAVAAALAGCGPQPGGTKATSADKGQAPPTAAETFQKPTPTEAAHDARVMTLEATTERITTALTNVRDRLKDMKAALETKGSTETDLLKVAGDLKTLTAQAREDCDAILRAARDLRAELPLAQKGYAATADFYRERADGYADPALRAVNLRMADEFDRLAAAAPRRADLTDNFIAQLTEVQEFLAQADRCLGDTKTALEILTAGPSPVKVSAESRAFRRHLEAFLALIEDYQKKLLAPPPAARPPRAEPARPTPAPHAPAEPSTTPEPKTPGRRPDYVVAARPGCPPPERVIQEHRVTDLSVSFNRPYRCPECGGVHAAFYKLIPDRPGYASLSWYDEPRAGRLAEGR